MIWAVIALLNAYVLGELGMYGRNTLDRHPDWFLGKVLVQRQPFGSSEVRVSRNLLAQNRLNLDAWYGSHELYCNRVLKVDRVRFRFRLADGAYVCFGVRTREGLRGVCLSRTAAFALDADERCAFRSREPLALPALDGGWHRCEVTPDSVAVDGVSVKLPLAVLGEGIYGFRGSTAAAQVDDVEFGEFLEDFRNDRHAAGVWLYSAVLVVAVSVVSYLWQRFRRRPLREAILRTVLFNLGLAALLVSWLAFDYVYWSKTHNFYLSAEGARRRFCRLFNAVDPLPSQVSGPTGAVRQFLNAPPEADLVAFQNYRVQVFREGQTFFLKDEVDAIVQFRRAHPRARRSVLFLGSSQTWGEGAYRDEQTMLARVAELLGPDTEVVNAARQGTNAVVLRHRYMVHLHAFQPDLVVVNLGNNDEDLTQFAGSLRRIYEFNKVLSVPTLFSLEANNPENPPDGPPHLARKHRIMKDLAARLGAPVVDLDGFLRSHLGSGFLWWDHVHPTSHGHALAGQFLADAVLKEWRKPRP